MELIRYNRYKCGVKEFNEGQFTNETLDFVSTHIEYAIILYSAKSKGPQIAPEEKKADFRTEEASRQSA